MEIYSFIKNFFETLMGFQEWRELLKRLKEPDVLNTFVQLMGGGITVSPSERGDRDHKEYPDWSDMALFVRFMERVYSRLARERGVSSLNNVDPFFLKLVAILHGKKAQPTPKILHVPRIPWKMFSSGGGELVIVFHQGGFQLELNRSNCLRVIKTEEIPHGTRGMALINSIMKNDHLGRQQRLFLGPDILRFLAERPGWFFDPFFRGMSDKRPTIIFPGTIGEAGGSFFLKGYRYFVGPETYQIQDPPP